MARAKARPNLGAALDDLTAALPASEPAAMPARSRAGRRRREEQTTLVGGQLARRYGRSLNLLSAETGKTNRELLEEALDGLFTKYGARIIDV